MKRHQGRLFTNVEVIFYITLSVCAVLSAAYLYLVNKSNEIREVEKVNAEQLISKISSELGEVTGVMASVVNIQQILDDPYGDQLESFASNAVEQSKLIKTIVRYERVEVGNLIDFSQTMSESGAYNFSLGRLQTNGKRAPVTVKDIYYPVIWRQPFGPRSANLIGVDVLSNENLQSIILKSESNNNPSFIPMPEGWPASNEADLLLMRPTYFGRYLPSSTSELETQSNGGFLMGLDLTGFIEKQNLLLPGYELEISILPGDSRGNIGLSKYKRTQSGGAGEKTYLPYLFSGTSLSAVPTTANTSIQIRVSTKGGIHAAGLFEALMMSFGLSLIISLLFVMLYNIRKSDAAHKKERESALITLRAIGDSVVTTNNQGVVTYANPSTEKLLRRKNNDLVGHPIFEAVEFHDGTTGASNQNVSNLFQGAFDQSVPVNLPEMNLNISGEASTIVASSVSPLGTDKSTLSSGHVLIMRDVTAERELTRELEFLATHDSLTKIANRYHFEKNLESLVSSSVNQTNKHAICYIDLDQFKTINDTCGHTAGDQLLIRVSNDLKSITRDSDLLARLGGDEFGLLIHNCSEDEAIQLAKRVFAYFQTMYFQHEEDVFAVRASIGFVYIDGQFTSIQDVMAAADIACYAAKDRGRNELYIFDHNGKESSDRMSEMMWLPKLQMALRSDGFRLFVQPIVDISNDNSSTFTHYEILLRLLTEDGKLITPVQLIEAAERYNIMRDIDRWVVGNAIDSIARLKLQMGSKVPSFSINISGQSSIDDDLAEFIKLRLEQTQLDPAKLIFEITETSAITNMQSAVNMVDRLHEIGCKLALDDFGSGVSSFGYLKSLPVDYLKIDGQFIKDINNSDVDREMVKCMQAVARLLNISTVAEFVENKEIETELKSLNIDFAQGYYYSKPHPIEELFDSDLKKSA